MNLGVLATTAATTTLVFGAVVSLVPAQDAPEDISTVTSGMILKFDHQAHAELDTPVNIEDCASCHGDDPGGELAKPGKHGHQPCLSSGCHAEDFLSVGTRTQKKSPDRYTEAAQFCLGCHENRSSEVGQLLAPTPYSHALANNLYRNNASPGHYVEMDHLEHAKRTECRTCHIVDDQSFALVPGGPGHDECASCHGDSEKKPMGECASCHKAGDAKTYFVPRSVSSDVRSCNTSRFKDLVASRKSSKARDIPCFEHEREGHRTTSKGEEVQCSDCHFMFLRKTYQKHNYQTLQEIKQAPLMDNSRDQAHRKCGASGCHRSQVDDSKGKGKCSMCHSSQSILGALIDTGTTRSKSPTTDTKADDKKKRRDKRRKKRGSLNDLID